MTANAICQKQIIHRARNNLSAQKQAFDILLNKYSII